MTEMTKIVEAYTDRFPTDTLIPCMDKEARFLDLFDALDNYRSVYGVLGVVDSIVRERCFSMLAEIMECDYEYIYEQWLRAV